MLVQTFVSLTATAQTQSSPANGSALFGIFVGLLVALIAVIISIILIGAMRPKTDKKSKKGAKSSSPSVSPSPSPPSSIFIHRGEDVSRKPEKSAVREDSDEIPKDSPSDAEVFLVNSIGAGDVLTCPYCGTENKLKSDYCSVCAKKIG